MCTTQSPGITQLYRKLSALDSLSSLVATSLKALGKKHKFKARVVHTSSEASVLFSQ